MHRSGVVLLRVGGQRRLTLAGTTNRHLRQNSFAPLLQSRGFARKSAAKRSAAVALRDSASPPPPAERPENAWQPVIDESSKQTYWWNTQTDETTPLGGPKPTTAYLAQDPTYNQPQYHQPQGSSLGQSLKEGFAFGAGAGIARGVVGSMFGGSGGYDDDYNDDGGDGGDWV